MVGAGHEANNSETHGVKRKRYSRTCHVVRYPRSFDTIYQLHLSTFFKGNPLLRIKIKEHCYEIT
jgi:hypothetical protein